MSKNYFAVIALTLLTCTPAVSQDYLLRFETVSLQDQPNGNIKPDAKVPDSVEIVVRNNVTFYCKTMVGSEKISVEGKVRELPDKKLLVQFLYKKSSPTGEYVPRVDGKMQAIQKTFTFNKTLDTIGIGKAVKTEGLVSNAKRMRTTLLIDYFVPSSDVE